MFQKLYITYGNMFHKFNEQGKDGYLIIGCRTPCKILYDLYLKFCKDGVTIIEGIPQDKKLKYWNIAKKYYQNTDERMRASKAAYALSLITSTD